MAIKKTPGETTFDMFNYLIMLLLMCITIYPILHIVFASFSDPRLLLSHEGLLFGPLGQPSWKGYEITFNNPSLLIGYRNTLFYVVIGTSINLFLTCMGAYVMSRRHFAIRKIMTILITVTMFFSGGMIPMFIIIRTLRLYDTIWALLLPSAISVYNMIIMRTFFYNIPVSLEEAALMDGAGDFTIFWRVVLPLSKPVIAVMLLYYGVARWNAWFDAMIYLRDRDLIPLQLVLREILMLGSIESTAMGTQQMMEESLYKELVQYCTMVVSTVPVLCAYPFLQKYFVKGVMLGAVKG
jgi:putative aldouronate transport system permease protein